MGHYNFAIPAPTDEFLLRVLDRVALEYRAAENNDWKRGWLQGVHSSLWAKCIERDLIHAEEPPTV